MTTAQSANTESSSSAPLITKNRMRMGVTHLSALSISSSDTSHILQNTVPSIIQASKEEKPMWMEDQEASSGNVELKAPGAYLIFFFSFFLSFLPPPFLSSFLPPSFPPFLSFSFLLFLHLTFRNIKLRQTYRISI